MPWYEGPTLLHHLENLYIGSDRNLIDARFPVQYVIRPMSDETTTTAATPGRWPAGIFKPATRSGAAVRLHHHDRGDRHVRGPVDEAFPPMSVTIRLADEIDISRGDMICRPHNQPDGQPGHRRHGLLVQRAPLPPGRKYAIKHTTRTARAMVKRPALPAGHQHAAPRRDGHGAGPERDRPRHAAYHARRCSSTSTAATARPAASS